MSGAFLALLSYSTLRSEHITASHRGTPKELLIESVLMLHRLSDLVTLYLSYRQDIP